MRAADRQPLILDFGCAFLMDELDPTMTTQVIGTPGYIPEEVYEDPKHRDVRQDVYACGVMIYKLIMGKLPRRSRYHSIEETFDGYVGLDAVVNAAIATEDQRTASVKELRSQLAAVAKANP